jgi:4-hydroxyphenylpyruvate dioxygenase
MNPLGIQGLSFVELASPTPSAIEALLADLGCSRTHEHAGREVDLYSQNDVRFLLTREHGTHAHGFAEEHGPSVSAIGLSVENAELATELAVRLGANEAPHGLGTSIDAPAIVGIGGSLVYFVEGPIESGLVAHRDPVVSEPRGLLSIDHLTISVHKGALERTAQFYMSIFGFTEHHDALRSPCGTFAVALNASDEDCGAGVRRIAFLADDVLGALDALGDVLPRCDIHRDEKGFLLKVFTHNVIGPISLEYIQRRAALLRSANRGRARRGASAT